jgi:hypothetical protein
MLLQSRGAASRASRRPGGAHPKQGSGAPPKRGAPPQLPTSYPLGMGITLCAIKCADRLTATSGRQ